MNGEGILRLNKKIALGIKTEHNGINAGHIFHNDPKPHIMISKSCTFRIKNEMETTTLVHRAERYPLI